MSRAVIYERFGGPQVLELREVGEPHAGPRSGCAWPPPD
jgi:hypothetical protein